MRFRSLGTRTPVFAVRGSIPVSRRTQATIKKRLITRVFVAISVHRGTLSFAHRYSPKTPQNRSGGKYGTDRPRCKSRNPHRSPAASDPLGTLLAGSGEGFCARLPPPGQR